MRRVPTDAESALWTVLRYRRLRGWKFRRQHVIAGYIVDFYCAELRLAIEVDGAIHDGQAAEDHEREADLFAVGVRIVRLRNADVLERIASVRDELGRCCEQIAAQRAL